MTNDQTMRNEILSHIHEPAQLEKLYRSDKQAFKRSFNEIYPELEGNALALFWNERLNYSKEEVSSAGGHDLVFALAGSVVAWFIAKLPAFFNLDAEFYYSRNIGFIIFPVLAAYFAWKNKLSRSTVAIIASVMIAALVYINVLPDYRNSDTITLACIHMVLFLWSVLGFAFVGDIRNDAGRLGYLKYNGDLVVMTTLIGIAFGLMTGITIGLFTLIGFSIEENYMKWVGVFGAVAAPIMGTYLTRTNPQLVGRVSPVIAKIFSPLVLIMLVTYLGAMIISKKDPFNDRDFLMIFNMLLIGVMAIIFFSVSDTSKEKTRAEHWILFLLSVLTIVVNGIALSAIIFRIAEWGFTPNRTAILGGNILILANLLLVSAKLFMVINGKTDARSVGMVIAKYLPVYIIWTIIVTFLFPMIFLK